MEEVKFGALIPIMLSKDELIGICYFQL